MRKPISNVIQIGSVILLMVGAYLLRDSIKEWGDPKEVHIRFLLGGVICAGVGGISLGMTRLAGPMMTQLDLLKELKPDQHPEPFKSYVPLLVILLSVVAAIASISGIIVGGDFIAKEFARPIYKPGDLVVPGIFAFLLLLYFISVIIYGIIAIKSAIGYRNLS